jgi:hypothetical protein
MVRPANPTKTSWQTTERHLPKKRLRPLWRPFRKSFCCNDFYC